MKFWLLLIFAFLMATNCVKGAPADDSGDDTDTDNADDSGDDPDTNNAGDSDDAPETGGAGDQDDKKGKIPKVVEIGAKAGAEIVDIFSEFDGTDEFPHIAKIVPKLRPFFDALEEVVGHPDARVYFSAVCENMTEVVTQFSVMDDLAEDHKDMKKLQEDYGRFETQISTLMTKFKEFLKASDEDQDVFKRTFIQTYNVIKKKSPRRHLLNGLEMDIPKRSMANTKNHRKKVQDIMKRMLVNIIHGSIAQLAWTRSEFPDSYDGKLKENVAEIEKLIPTMITWDQKVKFAWVKQAWMDIKATIKKKKGDSEGLADTLFTTLKEKYDWRAWNIMVYKKAKYSKDFFYRHCDAFVIPDGDRKVIAASVEKQNPALDRKGIYELMGKIPTKCNAFKCNLVENLYSTKVPSKLMSNCRDVALLVISKKWGKDVLVRGSKERRTSKRNGKFMFFAFA